MSEKQVVQKKGNTKTEVIIGAGVAKLERLVTDAKKIGDQFNGLVSLADDYSLRIVQAEQKLVELTNEAAELRRKQQVENEIAFRESKEAFVSSHLMSINKVAILEGEYLDMQQEIARLKSDQDKAVSKAEAIISNTLKRNYEQDLKLKEQEFIAKEATNAATINQLKEKVVFLEDQVKLWKGALDSERTASVERAKASAVGSINLQAGK